MRNASRALVLTVAAFSLAFSGMSQPPKKAAMVATGKSANWKVTIVKAQMYTKPRISPYNPNQYLEPPVYKKDCYNLALDLSFVYVGPPADVVAPSISVVDEKGETFHTVGNLSTSSNCKGLEWLITLASHPPGKRALKGGEEFGTDSPITFYVVDIPLSSTNIKVVFADVPPIPVKPTQLK